MAATHVNDLQQPAPEPRGDRETALLFVSSALEAASMLKGMCIPQAAPVVDREQDVESVLPLLNGVDGDIDAKASAGLSASSVDAGDTGADGIGKGGNCIPGSIAASGVGAAMGGAGHVCVSGIVFLLLVGITHSPGLFHNHGTGC